ncbi:uncharacterized protein LOC123701544 [Colias croceus]|uniref:uncharacterized protein LOC123701544 n=1 Tax=Colias crocea TaxID=72248 RepID=UPI001E2803B1|nr:uncharacterized protein LOC123701544 [Colias croceus]
MLSESERRYSEADTGPFLVHISKNETDPASGSTLRSVKVGQLLVTNGIKNIKRDGIKKIGRNRVSVEFSNADDANKFCHNPVLSNNNLTASIPTYNFSRMGIVRGVPTDISMQECVEALEIPQGFGIVLKARRLNRKKKTDETTEWIPTTTVVLTLQGQKLPDRVFLYKSSLIIETYQLPTIQCRKCCRFGHIKSQCRAKPRCFRCTKEHEGIDCNVSESSATCISCSGSHLATDPVCPEYSRQKNIKHIMSEESISYSEASLRFPMSRKSFADATRQIPSSPITYSSQNPSSPPTSSSYKKTVFFMPRPRAPLGKGYDKATHNDIVRDPQLESQNGCALSGTTPITRSQRESNVLISCLTFFYDIIKTCSDVDLPHNVKEMLFKILDTIRLNNGSEELDTMEC